MADWIDALACPVCGSELMRRDATLGCGSAHAFDLARQGYVNLLLPGTHTGTADSAEMVAARHAFFEAGHYRPLIDRVAELAAETAGGVPGAVVDAGAGTGEYLAATLDRLPERCGIALDLSKYACRRAAGAHARAGAVVCDTWGRLPLRDGSAAVVLNVFAPRNAAEFARVLAPEGTLVVVTPRAAHLGSLVERFGLVTVDPRKDERVEEQLEPLFTRESAEAFERELRLTAEEAALVVAMGPSARHSAGESARAGHLGTEPVGTFLSVTISVWRKRGEPNGRPRVCPAC